MQIHWRNGQKLFFLPSEKLVGSFHDDPDNGRNRVHHEDDICGANDKQRQEHVCNMSFPIYFGEKMRCVDIWIYRKELYCRFKEDILFRIHIFVTFVKQHL